MLKVLNESYTRHMLECKINSNYRESIRQQKCKEAMMECVGRIVDSPTFKTKYSDQLLLALLDVIANLDDKTITDNGVGLMSDILCGKGYIGTYNYILKESVQQYIDGVPDSFAEASCMCAALLKNSVFQLKATEKTPLKILILNYDLAFKTAKKIASEPITWNGNAVTEHPKIGINVPNGIVPNNRLEDDIITNLVRNDIHEKKFDIFGMANLLHLLYAYNSVVDAQEKERSYQKIVKRAAGHY